MNAQEPYFRGKFAEAAKNLEIEYENIQLSECVFHIHSQTTELYHNHTLIDPDSAYFWVRRKGQDNFYCYLLCEFLHQHNAPFTDPANRSHTLSDMKIAQLLRLTQQGVPFPESYICRSYSFSLHQDKILENLGFPLVVKRAGERGEAVWLIKDLKALKAKFQEAPYDVHIVQKFIPNEYDLRVIVFEDQIIGAMTRHSTDGFANTGYDAKLSLTDLSDEEKRLALDVAQKAGVDFAGVDIVRTEQGPMVWEINKTPQMDRFIPATGIDAVTEAMRIVKERYLS